MGRSCRRSPALAACAQPCPTWCVISKVSSACAIARSRQSWRELRSSFPVLTVKQQAWPGRLGLPRTGADSSCIRAGPAASLPSQRGSREALSWLSCAAACVHAQSSVRCRASTIPCGFGTSGADFLPVQNGPETVGLDGGDAVSAVGLRLGGIVTFCCSLSRTAAVQGSPLIVSLPRFVRRVEGSDYNPRWGENAGLSLKTKTRRALGARAALNLGRSRCWLALSLMGGRPTLPCCLSDADCALACPYTISGIGSCLAVSQRCRSDY
jgi:hypothetical protein